MALELLTFLGLALLLEGVVLALFPGGMKRMMVQFAGLTAQQLRVVGLGFAAVAALGLILLSRFGGDGGGGGMAFAFPETRAFFAGFF
ncbi:MAG: DUF2065 domain-containing protein [Alphaproteobacteria bacterium]|nr:DUF2065 domain-containing protein [Alphaproteobacteria bacterium]